MHIESILKSLEPFIEDEMPMLTSEQLANLAFECANHPEGHIELSHTVYGKSATLFLAVTSIEPLFFQIDLFIFPSERYIDTFILIENEQIAPIYSQAYTINFTMTTKKSIQNDARGRLI